MSATSLDRWDGLSRRARRSLLAEYGCWVTPAVFILLESLLDVDLPVEWYMLGAFLAFSKFEFTPGRGWRLWAALVIVPAMALALVTAGLAAFIWITGVAQPGDAEVTLPWFLFFAVGWGPGMALELIAGWLLRESPGTEADRLAAANAYVYSGRDAEGSGI